MIDAYNVSQAVRMRHTRKMEARVTKRHQQTSAAVENESFGKEEGDNQPESMSHSNQNNSNLNYEL